VITTVLPGPALNLAFVVVFGIFVAAFIALCVVTLTWAIRRDRRGRAVWLQRRARPLPPPAPNGSAPRGRSADRESGE
jgi:hypothetical protein